MWRYCTFLVLWVSSAQAMLPISCYFSVVSSSDPFFFVQYPPDQGDVQFRDMHWQVLRGKSVTPQQARTAAERLLKSLEAIALRLTGAPTDALLNEILENLYSGELLVGTGYRISQEVRLTGSPFVGWVTPANLKTATQNMAACSRIKPGSVHLPFFEEAHHNYEPLTSSDQHSRDLYMEKIRLCVEEYLYVVQYLRLYAGSKNTQVNVSAWARSSQAPFTIALAADIYVWLTENLGPVPSYWREFHNSRAACP